MTTNLETTERSALASSRRLVVKLGTQVVMGPRGVPALGRLNGILESVAAFRRQGRDILVVSSGAIGLGSQALGSTPRSLAEKQACAAVGQGRLMALYQEALAGLGLIGAQVLLTESDFTHRGRYLNLRSTLERLLDLGAVPIINENDTVSTAELETRVGFRSPPVFGDNDKLSALVAGGVGADALFILSDVEGLFTANPHKDSGAERIPWVGRLTADIEALADGRSARGRGGMTSKLAAVKVATRAGARVVIADGATPGVLNRILAGEDLGTLFSSRKPLRGRQRWIAHGSQLSGRIRVNEGARQALQGGRASLLATGVTALEGAFGKDDVVAIADEQGRDFGRGLATLPCAEMLRLLAEPVGARALVHRNSLVLLEEA